MRQPGLQLVLLLERGEIRVESDGNCLLFKY